MYIYIIYKITCNVNGKFYIGKHKTKDISDKYFGSGKVLKRAIAKHGIDNFSKSILHICESEEKMNELEKEIVNADMLKNPACYNLAMGGHGGYVGEAAYKRRSELWTADARKAFSEYKKKQFQDPEFKERFARSMKGKKHSWAVMSDDQKDAQRKSMSTTISKCWENPDHREKMSRVTRERMKATVTDKFKYATKGRVWISKDGANRLVSRDEAERAVNAGWVYGLNRKASVTGYKHALGKIAITNLETGKCKMVLSENVNTYLTSGWRLGTARRICP